MIPLAAPAQVAAPPGLSLAAGAGSYSITGTAASLIIRPRKIVAAAGSYAVTGSSATLQKGGRAIQAGVGSYTVTGTAASVLHKWKVTAAAGSYSMTGTAATLTLASSNDPNFASVKLLLGFEGVDAATSTSDESGAAHGGATFNGNAQLDTAQFKYGASSLLLDGTGDYITFPDSADWDLSDNNSDLLTVECFIRPHAASNMAIVGQGSFGGNTLSWVFVITTAKQLLLYTSSGGNTITNTIGAAGTVMTLDTWYHVAFDKDATGKIRLYVDGTMASSATPADSTFFNSTGLLQIGRNDTVSDFNGWIDELRITKGVARYASDGGFTAPTAAFPRS